MTQLIKPLDEAQLACVDLLAQALTEAKEGKIDSVAIIVCMEGGYASVMAGYNAGGLPAFLLDSAPHVQATARGNRDGGNRQAGSGIGTVGKAVRRNRV